MTIASAEKDARAEKRQAEAAWIRKNDSFAGVEEVLDLAKPRGDEARDAATTAAAQVAEKLEAALEAGTQKSDIKLKSLSLEKLRARLQRAAKSKSDEDLALIARQWTHNYDDYMEFSGSASERGPHMYPLVSAFILYVQRHVKAMHAPAAARKRGGSLTAARLLLPSAESDFTPNHAHEDEKVGLALHNCPVSAKPQPHPGTHPRDFFAIVACKVLYFYDEALDQLIDSTRRVYWAQGNRRFAWALSVCSRCVYAVVMLHDAVLVSPVMDVSKPAGRKQFVELLVNWAVCDDVRAGYDPTMEFDPISKQYRIQCPNKGGKMRTYTTTGYLFAQGDVLGRHTRCFVAERDRKKGGPKEVVVIKDAFTVSKPPPDDNVHNEIVLLSEITDTFRGKELDFIYPELVRGGNVVLPTGGSQVSGVAHNGVYDFDDNTDGILSLMGVAREDVPEAGKDGVKGKRSSWRQQPYRIHRRLAMRPCGEELEMDVNQAELTVVLAEAMRCHTAIHSRCKILHRDISPNNFLVVRGSDGLPRGLLIDFDYAISVKRTSQIGQPGQSGTLPVMSIGNLEYDGTVQTALDDWESLLYTLCMWGTRGLTSEKRRDGKRVLTDLPIGEWSRGTCAERAREKRNHMRSADDFWTSIGQHFHPSCRALEPLAVELHAALFLREGCAGTRIKRPDLDIPNDFNPCMLFEAPTRV
ncbi:hypothetical protein IWQ57_000256 [Coemansia nantahalensis]|uniref:Uncharacterized protein n=1 Tax=Coemansia nantahalensis TaxID=2789366 RepID=A0ACC1K952_9FUNG|nr:hypothetical protein IWQ57_000256 [Coemansia nantahalensis]